jgi:hypothetical protein
MRRVAVGLAAAVTMVLLAAAPAAADPARPTNYESRISRLEPATDAVRVDVVGGDSFLRLRVEPGHEVVVFGYDVKTPDPYLRVLADGTVEQNLRSPAVVLNQDRYAAVGDQPEDVDPAAEPRWDRVGDGGTYVWHDHRSHFMGKALPPQLGGADSGVVFEDWQVPLVVDGTPTVVHGVLERDRAPSPLPWLALAAVVAVVAAVVALRTERLIAVASVLTVAAVTAFAVSAPGQYGMPAAAGRQYHLVFVPVIAGAAALAALALRKTPYGVALVAGAALALPLWVFGTVGVLTHAHAPTDVAEAVQRATVALVIGSIGAALLVGAAHEARALRGR